MFASTTYSAFGSTATVFALTGYDRLRHNTDGWYAIYYSFPAQPTLSFVDRTQRDHDSVLAAIRCQIGRNEVDPMIVETTEGRAGEPI
ncbi:hypothetical protein ACNQR7_32060 [Mycolicibacterium senegalense]|uniref:hypothetical protein n=1 Tax=Mycolicibacterium senegalense TaxID=1796 RepID=UPI003AAEE3C2